MIANENLSAPIQGTPVLDTHEASEYVGPSVSWLQKARLLGVGPPFVKVGSRIVYRRQALDAWLRANEYQPSGGRAKAW